jgi:hypothetical protein
MRCPHGGESLPNRPLQTDVVLAYARTTPLNGKSFDRQMESGAANPETLADARENDWYTDHIS